MPSQYTTNKFQSQITSQQCKIEAQQSEIGSQQRELQTYQSKIQHQEYQIREKDSTIQSQNQTLQYEKMKKNSDTPSKQTAPASLLNSLDQAASQRQNLRSITDKFANTFSKIQSNSVGESIMKTKQTVIGQRVNQATQAYHSNQISIQIPKLTFMTMPLNLLA